MKISIKLILLTGVLFLLVGVIGVAVMIQGGANSDAGLTTIDQEKKITASNVKNLEIETDTADITFLPADTDEIKVHLLGTLSEKQLKSCDLQATTSTSQTWHVEACKHKGISLGIDVAELRSWFFTPKEDKLRVEVSLPLKAYVSMNIHTATGTIDLGDIQANKLMVQSDTGSIHVGQFQGNGIDLQTDTGRIEVQRGEGDIRFKTSTGSIRAGLQNTANSVDIETDTGGIQVDHIPSMDMHTTVVSRSIIRLKTSTGGITAALASIGNGVDATSDTGSIRLKFAAIPSAASFDLSSDTSRVNLLVPGVDFDEKEKHHIAGSIGTGGPEVQVKSSTGSIEVSTGQ
jgi:DUF4097 and DUF4098 domain-containing protein YvlB